MPLKSCARHGCQELVPLGTRLCAVHAREEQSGGAVRRDRSARAETSRALYRTKRWHRLRELVLRRAGGCCERPGCNATLTRGRKGPKAAMVDHIWPHRGDHALFFDVDNLWALCRPCHDTWKARIEHRGDVGAILDALPPNHPARALAPRGHNPWGYAIAGTDFRKTGGLNHIFAQPKFEGGV